MLDSTRRKSEMQHNSDRSKLDHSKQQRAVPRRLLMRRALQPKRPLRHQQEVGCAVERRPSRVGVCSSRWPRGGRLQRGLLRDTVQQFCEQRLDISVWKMQVANAQANVAIELRQARNLAEAG